MIRELIVAALFLAFAVDAPAAQFLYRGTLAESGSPANGSYGLRVSVFGSADATAPLAGQVTYDAVDVVDGTFAVPLDIELGAATKAWVEVAVRGPGDADFIPLDGRQAIDALAGGTCWELTGNAGTAPAGNFVGTSDGAPLRIRGGGGVGVNTATPDATTVMTVLGGSGNGGTLWLASPKGPNVSHVHFGTNGEWFLRSATNTGRVVLQDSATTAQVAIGTAAPQADVKLHVQAGAAPTLSPALVVPTVRVESAGVAALDLSGANGTVMTMRNTGGAAARFVLDGNSLPASRLQIGALTGTELRIMDQGVGIGRDPLAFELEVEGNASKTTAGSWLAHSDARIKTGVETVRDALDTLARIRLVAFRYTPEYLARHPSIADRAYLNVIAQEFAEVFPDWVVPSGEQTANGEPILQVDTHPITIVTAAAVQELRAELELRDERIAALEARLARLERAGNR